MEALPLAPADEFGPPGSENPISLTWCSKPVHSFLKIFQLCRNIFVAPGAAAAHSGAGPPRRRRAVQVSTVLSELTAKY